MIEDRPSSDSTVAPPIEPTAEATAQPTAEPRFHSTSLVIWCLAAVLPVALTSNPIYLGIGLVMACALFHAVARGSEDAEAWGGFARFGAFFVLLSMAFNLFFGTGGETVLVELPSWQPEPSSPFQVGGSLTLEGLILALTSAAALVTLVLVMACFNALVDHYFLLRSLPSFLNQAATVVSIGLALLPQWFRAQREIRQAQALRGHRVRKLRDFLPMIWALLSEALEKAMVLAESMEARGFGSASPAPRGFRWSLLIALISVFGGWLALDLGPPRWIGTVLVVLGSGLLVETLRRLGRRGRRTRYRRQVWRARDSWLTAWSLGAALVLGALALGPSLSYGVLPLAESPPFDLRVLPSMSVVLAPWVLRWGFRDAADERLELGDGIP